MKLNGKLLQLSLFLRGCYLYSLAIRRGHGLTRSAETYGCKQDVFYYQGTLGQLR